MTTTTMDAGVPEKVDAGNSEGKGSFWSKLAFWRKGDSIRAEKPEPLSAEQKVALKRSRRIGKEFDKITKSCRQRDRVWITRALDLRVLDMDLDGSIANQLKYKGVPENLASVFGCSPTTKKIISWLKGLDWMCMNPFDRPILEAIKDGHEQINIETSKHPDLPWLFMAVVPFGRALMELDHETGDLVAWDIGATSGVLEMLEKMGIDPDEPYWGADDVRLALDRDNAKEDGPVADPKTEKAKAKDSPLRAVKKPQAKGSSTEKTKPKKAPAAPKSAKSKAISDPEKVTPITEAKSKKAPAKDATPAINFCHGKKGDGTPCGLAAKKGQNYCQHHGDQAPK